jgi:4-alpha-glucanotransferase
MAMVTLRVHYATRWGENLLLDRLLPGKERDAANRQTLEMRQEGEGFWSVQLAASEASSVLEYRYEVRDSAGSRRFEPAYRKTEVTADSQVVWDHFLVPEWPDGVLLRQAFAGIIFNPAREAVTSGHGASSRLLRITMRAPRVAAGHRLCISGSHELLGGWVSARARIMSSLHYPLWELDLPAEEFGGRTEFKFGFWDERTQGLIQWEDGPNRVFYGMPPGPAALVVNYEHFCHPKPWRGAGIAIPVFSLRTDQGYGIGEFSDLALFAEWAANCNLHLIQLLPVNDTSSDFTWRDSYPYKAISAAALHPIYLNVERLFSAYGVSLPEKYAARRSALNRLKQLDYEQVLKDKLEYLRELFSKAGKITLEDPDFKRYQRENNPWLQPYAGFCRLRDLHGTADFTQWGKQGVYRPSEISAWFKEGASEYDEVMLYCWAQFHLDRQLAEALAAGHARGVAFKGDLPIGIDRASVEAWSEPELFRMDRQTGAPPDAFAVLGQNWGFPTYNWPRMEADDYAWWRRRFHRMSAAFDALRVDHILGFFRIWEIPMGYEEGIMGHYNPALPLSRREIAEAGFGRAPEQFSAGAAQAESLEVLFLEDPDQPEHFHPRINLAETSLFRALSEREQAVLRQLHDDFYYRRHTQFWADEAMKKLPVLMDASPMLICGEDLGMVPDSVPIVLKRLSLLSLEVQRWPKKLGLRFGNPADYPYLSVCTTSTHDMSTIRGWWEEEPEARQQFWTEVMRRDGTAPAECSPGICRHIVEQNLAGASMWCVLPLQDWLGVHPQLRHPVAAEERINVPAVPRHYWRYRMHLTVESLLEADEFNRTMREMVEASGRSQSV